MCIDILQFATEHSTRNVFLHVNLVLCPLPECNMNKFQLQLRCCNLFLEIFDFYNLLFWKPGYTLNILRSSSFILEVFWWQSSSNGSRLLVEAFLCWKWFSVGGSLPLSSSIGCHLPFEDVFYKRSYSLKVFV